MTSRVERLINLVIALRETQRPLPVDEIRQRVAGYGQRDYEAFRRMFERDKADLRALGVPLETEPVDVWEDRVGYRILPERYDLPPLRLTRDEVAALALAVEASGLGETAGAALLKLSVDAGAPEAAAATDPPLGIEPLGDRLLLDLLEAQVTRTAVSFPYRTAAQPARTRPHKRHVDPHALVHRRGRWYIVGYDHDRRARRAFRLDRIAGDVRRESEPGSFPPSPEADVSDVVPHSGDPLVLEVAAAPGIAWQVARRARGDGRPVHDEGDVGEPDDARDWRVFEVAVPDLDSAVTWALEHGPELEVLGPQEVRDAIVARLQGVLELRP